MEGTWEDLADDALKDGAKPISTDTTNIAKFGAPAAGIVTALLAAFVGNEWNLDPERSEVVVAAGIVAAAVVLGVYYAFASDIRSRAAAAIARMETLGELAVEEMGRNATRANDAAALLLAEAARDAAVQELAAVECDLKVAKAALGECHAVRTTAQTAAARTADDKVKLDASVADLQAQLRQCTEAHAATKQALLSSKAQSAASTKKKKK